MIPADLPIRPTTYALAAMQTTINAAGLTYFRGDIDRFGIYALIVAQTHPRLPSARPIAIHSISLSLGRPFETVRRHVNGLLEAGLGARSDGRIVASPAIDDDPALVALQRIAHDSFVRMVEDLRGADMLPELSPTSRSYDPVVGVAAAAETLLAAVGSNRHLHHDWLSLAIFSAALLGNARRYMAREEPGTALKPHDAVRSAALARVLNLPESTLRRRLAALTAPGAPLLRAGGGVLVSSEWLASNDAAEVSTATYAAIRLILSRAAAGGFPFGHSAPPYLAGPPVLPQFH